MKTRINLILRLALALTLALITVTPTMAKPNIPPPRPQGPCDVYAAGGAPCAAAHSTTRALYASYNGPLYQVLRQSDGKTKDIGVVQPTAKPFPDAGGYADAAAQDAFCANTTCWITTLYDQSPMHNDLTQAPRGGFSGPAMGGFNNIPIADMAPITIMGHKAYGVFIEPGMGLRDDDPVGTAVDDQAEGQYWVLNGLHYNSGCCFDYGNAEIDSRDDGNGTMETTYYGNATSWYQGPPPGPWIMTDQENNLTGCVRFDSSSKLCDLPSITWRFVTATTDGEPHYWRSMGGDAQQGPMSVMFEGARINATYDPMRKQGAILLGNGGDNSNGSQGTFYEGAMTAAGTMPTQETNQLIQANVVAAKYDVQRLSLAPASAVATPPGLQTFAPRSSQDTTVTFVNTTGPTAVGVKLSIVVPTKQWTSFVPGTTDTSVTFDEVLPGASVSATFRVTSGPAAFNGDLIGKAEWTNPTSGGRQSETTTEKVRNVSPIKINEFRISTSSPTNSTNSFIELYNAGDSAVNLSGWTLTQHPTQQAIFSTIKIPAGTTLAAGGFYLLGLANSGLAVPASAGDSTIYVRATTGLTPTHTIDIDGETRTIVSVGTAASSATTLWQPLPEGPVITIPAGSTNVPVTSVSGFQVGQKIALGYGVTYPTVSGAIEKYEVATVTAVGLPGTQAFLRAIARPGDTNIKVSAVSNIAVGDRIRLDIDSVGHGIEWVTVTAVGTQARSTSLSGGNTYLIAPSAAGDTNIKVTSVSNFVAGQTIQVGYGPNGYAYSPNANIETAVIAAVGTAGASGTGLTLTAPLSLAHPLSPVIVMTPAGATNIKVASVTGFVVGDKMDVGTCYDCETVTITAVGTTGASGTGVDFTPALARSYLSGQSVVYHGTGLDLAAPLQFEHASNLPFSDGGTGISFEPATAFPHSSNEPVQALGTGITLDSPLVNAHDINAVVRDALVTTAGYQGTVVPNQWFGGPAVATTGMMVLRDAAGRVADSLNIGGLVDPWAAEGYQATSGSGQSGCRVTAPSSAAGEGRSRGRFPDGFDTDSNCTDFLTQSGPSTTLARASAIGDTNIKVASVTGLSAGQTLVIDTGANLETAVIATVGTPGATTVRTATAVGETVIPVASVTGFSAGQIITIDSGANYETATVVSTTSSGGARITVSAPLAFAHAVGVQVSGTGIDLTAALTLAHASGAPVVTSVPTPGGPTFNPLTLTKSADPAVYSYQGQVIVYTYVIANVGGPSWLASPVASGPFTIRDDRLGTFQCGTATSLAPGDSTTCTQSYTIQWPDDMNVQSITNRATATGSFGTTVVTSNQAEATITHGPQTSKITPASVTCKQFAQGGATDLFDTYYEVASGKISSVSPSGFNYFSKVYAPASSFQIQVRQTNDYGWNSISVSQIGQVVLYNANCTKSSAQGTTTFDAATGTVTIQVNNAVPANGYYLGAQYNAGSLVGAAVSSPYPEVTYVHVTYVDGVEIRSSWDGIAANYSK